MSLCVIRFLENIGDMEKYLNDRQPAHFHVDLDAEMTRLRLVFESGDLFEFFFGEKRADQTNDA